MSPRSERLHSLDALRAIAMLGVVAYHVVQLSQDGRADRHPAAEFFLWATHAWRMPIFFLLSGFFTELILDRKGFSYAWKNRRDRIFFPLAAALLIVWPITLVAVRAYNFLQANSASSIFSAEGFLRIFDHFVRKPSYFHLWFLVYLAAMLIAKFGWEWLRRPERNSPSFLSFAALILAAAALLALMKNPFEMDTPTRVFMKPYSFLFLSLFFIAGFLFYRAYRHHQFLFGHWKAAGTATLIMGAAVISQPTFVLPLAPITMSDWASRLQMAIPMAGFVIAGTLFCIAAAKNIFSWESPTIRFLTASSFFVYLVHHPLLYSVGASLHTYAWPFWQEVSFLMVGAYALSFALFGFVVRGSWLEIFLNGRSSKPQNLK